MAIRPRGLARRLFARWQQARRRSRDERDLRSMSAHELTDLGIGGSQIAASMRHGRDGEASRAAADPHSA